MRREGETSEDMNAYEEEDVCLGKNAEMPNDGKRDPCWEVNKRMENMPRPKAV